MTYISTIQSSLSIGQLAAIVNGLLLLLQSLVSSAFAILLYGFSDDHPHDNDIVRRVMHNTLWPFIVFLFRTNSGTEKRWERIKKSIWPFGIVILMRGIVLFCIVSFVVGGFLVPLPLGNILSEGHETEANFVPLQDKSFFGKGTLGTPSPAMTRRCSYGSYDILKVCPGGTGNISTISEEYKSQFGVVMSKHHLPSPFDVRYRTWYLSEQYAQDTRPPERQPIGDMNPITSHVLDNSYVLVEGLILDMIHGGVGLRNHTGPASQAASQAHGATWSEPILWLTPLTECVSTNLSFHYTYFSSSNISDGYLQDDGGFANAASPEPFETWYEYGWDSNTRNVPNLHKSAYETAWWNNNITQRMMRIKKPKKAGSQYTNRLSTYFNDFVSPGTLIISDADVDYIDLTTDVEEKKLREAFVRIGLEKCSGYNEDREDATSVKPFVRCGYLFTMPHIKGEQGHKLRFDEGSKWQQELYVCASAVKSSIRAVTFKSDGVQSLDNITVTDVQDISFTEDSAPLWGLEAAKGFKISAINRIWGLMSDAYNGSLSFTTARTSELFLPASSLDSFLFTARDLFAAGSVFQTAWNDVFRHAAPFVGSALRQIPSYSGDNDYAIALKWRELSRTPEGGALICKLIWTDLVAFALTSQQTGFPVAFESKVPPGSVGRRMVTPFVTILVYNQFWYSIAAIIATFLVLLGTIMTFFVLIFGKRLKFQGRIKRGMTFEDISKFLEQDKAPQTVPVPPGSQPTLASDSTLHAPVEHSSDGNTQTATINQSTGGNTQATTGNQSTDGNLQRLNQSSDTSNTAESTPRAPVVPESSRAPDSVDHSQENQRTASGASNI